TPFGWNFGPSGSLAGCACLCCGYHVRGFVIRDGLSSTGLQAIETARRCGRLSLLVSDIELPDLSGTEVALVLYGYYPQLAVLFVSANTTADWESHDRTNLKRFTSDLVDFLEKPFSTSELELRVRNLIGRRIRLAKKYQGTQAA